MCTGAEAIQQLLFFFEWHITLATPPPISFVVEIFHNESMIWNGYLVRLVTWGAGMAESTQCSFTLCVCGLQGHPVWWKIVSLILNSRLAWLSLGSLSFETMSGGSWHSYKVGIQSKKKGARWKGAIVSKNCEAMWTCTLKHKGCCECIWPWLSRNTYSAGLQLVFPTLWHFNQATIIYITFMEGFINFSFI